MNQPTQPRDGRSEPQHLVEAGYDSVAEEYGRLEGPIPWPRMRWLVKLLSEVGAGSSILDLGCGSGDPVGVHLSKEHKVTGVDISQAQIALARARVPAGHFIHGDAGSVDFPPGSFDAVVSFYSLEHIPRRQHAELLRRVHKWLRKGGHLLFAVEAADYDDVTGEWLGVPMFLSCHDPDTTRRLVREAGFDILETAIETQVEQDHEVPYLWVFARRR